MRCFIRRRLDPSPKLFGGKPRSDFSRFSHESIQGNSLTILYI
jgi:hypothetical protein